MFWIEQMLPRQDIVQLLSHATVFVCPSVYEPFGLINVEAMACEVPVVASADWRHPGDRDRRPHWLPGPI